MFVAFGRARGCRTFKCLLQDALYVFGGYGGSGPFLRARARFVGRNLINVTSLSATCSPLMEHWTNWRASEDACKLVACCSAE